MSLRLARAPQTPDALYRRGMTTDPYERVISRLDPNRTEDDCHIWPGSRTPNGYGTVMVRPPYVKKARPLLVHRVVYEREVGPIPEGLDSDHLCRVRLCCNSKHIEPVTRIENSHRGTKYRPDQCAQGHAYPENMTITPEGWARCRECNRIKCRARRRRVHSIGKSA